MGHADIVAAEFIEPTTRYGHAVLGDNVEYGALKIVTEARKGAGEDQDVNSQTYTIRLPQDHVFEDLAPRLWDVTGDDIPEVVVIETDVSRGAQLAVYSSDGAKLAATPHIGTRNRWLAPVGAADLDGDGHIEIAYVDRPHLAKTLRIWRFDDGHLREVAHVTGLTNHRIGEAFITSGVRTCEDLNEIVTVDGGWSRLIASQLTDEGQIIQRDIGPYRGRKSMRRALECN